MSVVSMKQLLEAGVHFGHQTRRWNPKMAPYIFTERNGIYIIDLQQTIQRIDDAYDFIRKVAADGATIDDTDHGNVIITNTHTPKETPKKDTPKKGSSPKTGDENKLGHYAVELIASSMMLTVVAAKKRRKNIQ